MESLAQRLNLDSGLLSHWLSCTFVYMLGHDNDSFTLKLASVSPTIEVSLSEQYIVTREQYRMMTGMYQPAFVFGQSYTELSPSNK
jgi:hypothetical protein